MKKNINESFNFLLLEHERLELKAKNKTITKEEKETLKQLVSFLGKDEYD